MNEVIKTLLTHKSIRRYSDKAVSDEDLLQIIKAAQAAPNWVNLQLVSMVIIKNDDNRKRMSELCGEQPHVAQAPVFIVFCADYRRVAIACKNHGQSLDEVMTDIDTVVVGAHEAGIALEAATVAAESLGLGTVPIGDVRLHPKEMIEALDLPEYVFPMIGLCVGYPAENPGLKPRLPIEAVCFSEKYNVKIEPYIENYDKEYSEYLKLRPWNSRVGNWSDLAADFYKTPFHYKDEANALASQGFNYAKQMEN